VTPAYTGDAWSGFDPKAVSAVRAADTTVDRFVVYDLRTAETFYRPRGSDGDLDQPTTPPAVPTTTPPPTPAPTVVTCPRGTHLSGSRCVANAPPRCPAGEVREGGRCVATQISCPDGTHASDDGASCDRDVPDCPDGSHRDDGSCVPDRSSDTSDPQECGDGFHQSGEGGGCVPDQPSAPQQGYCHGPISGCGRVTGRRPSRDRRPKTGASPVP
jgi:hypothetical protein